MIYVQIRRNEIRDFVSEGIELRLNGGGKCYGREYCEGPCLEFYC